MQLALVSYVLLISGTSGYIPLSSLKKATPVTSTNPSSNNTSTNNNSSSSITESPWEEKIVFGNNEVSTNKRINDRFLDKPMPEEKHEVSVNRNKRQPEVVRLHDEKQVTNTVESVIKHVENVIAEFKKKKRFDEENGGKMEHRGGSFDLPEVKKFIYGPSGVKRIARQGAVSDSSQSSNAAPVEGRIVNRPSQQTFSNPSIAFGGFRPMTNIGNRLMNYVTPDRNKPFITGNPQQQLFIPNQQIYQNNYPQYQNYPYPQQQQQQQQQQYYNQQPYYRPQQQPTPPQPFFQYYPGNYQTQLVTHHIPVTIAIPFADPSTYQAINPIPRSARYTPPANPFNARGGSAPFTVRTSSPQRPILNAIADRIRPPLPPGRGRPADLSVNIFNKK
ncbi:myb-like protein K [Neocloeon triangulifer]|uniref:myb-like protein K n=1 Tax=Neocloeon triangulifer TaxID=2078957 RepID=UPI00286EE796|nr:myb-like protein K [Neocloeon triangulifer]